MTTFKIAIIQKVKQSAVVTIEADNEDDAREKVERMWRQGEAFDWTEDDVDESFGVETEVVDRISSALKRELDLEGAHIKHMVQTLRAFDDLLFGKK